MQTVSHWPLWSQKTPLQTDTHLTASFPAQPGYAVTRKVKPIWILTKQQMTGRQWHQLDHMQIICTSLQTDNHASTSLLNFLQAGCPLWHPTNSVKALKAQGTATLFPWLRLPADRFQNPFTMKLSNKFCTTNHQKISHQIFNMLLPYIVKYLATTVNGRQWASGLYYLVTLALVVVVVVVVQRWWRVPAVVSDTCQAVRRPWTVSWVFPHCQVVSCERSRTCRQASPLQSTRTFTNSNSNLTAN